MGSHVSSTQGLSREHQGDSDVQEELLPGPTTRERVVVVWSTVRGVLHRSVMLQKRGRLLAGYGTAVHRPLTKRTQLTATYTRDCHSCICKGQI